MQMNLSPQFRRYLALLCLLATPCVALAQRPNAKSVVKTPGGYNLANDSSLQGTILSYAENSKTPPLGTLYYYLVSRVDACRESILGRDSAGVAIPNNNPCPNPPVDTDGDGAADVVDNCPAVANPGQADADLDNHGNACDNCPATSNPDQSDGDGDTIGDLCDPTP